MKRRNRSLAVAVVLAAVLCTPGAATAGTKSKSVTRTANLQTATITIKCPDGQKATGGGYRQVLPPGGEAFIVWESRKIGQRRWQVSATLFTGGNPVKLTAHAYCSNDAPSTTTKSATAVGPGNFSTADAKCSSGKAQAGGFFFPAPASPAGEVIEEESYRYSNTTWRTSAILDVGRSITSYVYCARSKSPTARLGATTGSGNEVKTATSPKCKSGTSLLAGGVSQPGFNPEAGQLFTIPFNSFGSGKRWYATAVHSGPSTTTLAAIAYCG